ncbi:MAG: hypothetical protein K2X82_08020 [Gemmataceae bacterium]|nr:hypothetical protein [Gemmataceae bacterium]
MATIPPIVRQMLVCEDVRVGGNGRPGVDVLGLAHVIGPRPGESFPLPYPGLCVYLRLSGGVGTGRAFLRLVEADTDDEVIRTPEFEVAHPPDRHRAAGVIVRPVGCVFPRPGLYWVEFYHDGLLLRQEPLTVRPT